MHHTNTFCHFPNTINQIIIQNSKAQQYSQYLNYKKMLTSPQRQHIDHPPNLLISLKQKKKQLLLSQSSIKHKIKQYFSDLTIIIHDKETQALQAFQKQLFNLFQCIDYYCALKDNQRAGNQNKKQIQRILGIKIGIGDDTGLKDALREYRVDFGIEGLEKNSGFGEARTSKKGKENQFLALKENYQHQIISLEQKIQKLSIKQEKLKLKIQQLESRHKMKKVGNTYLPYQQKFTPNLLIQRLESENKLLIAQISDSSEKILALRTENSLLKQTTHLIPTQKKRMLCQSAQQESVEESQNQKKLQWLQVQIQQLRSCLERERQLQRCRQDQFICAREQEVEQHRIKIEQFQATKQKLLQDNKKLTKKLNILQQQLHETQSKLLQTTSRCQSKQKQAESIKQMNNNYARLLKIKDQKIQNIEKDNKENYDKMIEVQDQLKKDVVQKKQKIQNQQLLIKSKCGEIQSLKSVLKKQNGIKAQLNEKLSKMEQNTYNMTQNIQALQGQLQKSQKQKQLFAKKQVQKVKKELKKVHEEQKNHIIEDFKHKCGQFMEKIQILKKQSLDNREKYERKYKIQENWMEIFKNKLMFEVKEMIEKINKSGQKDKVCSIIQSYIENQASITMKNTQIKMLKQEISNAKKQPQSKKQQIKPSTQADVAVQLQQFSTTLFQQKLSIQQKIYETRLKQQQEQYSLQLQQKQSKIQQLSTKCQNYGKNLKQVKVQLNNANLTTNPEIAELKKINEEKLQKEQRLESFISGLKNSLAKAQSQGQQAKDELKLKKDIIQGLKKQLKDRQQQKTKLNETMNSLMQEMQRIKKTKKQANKKQAIFEEFKDKLINQTQLSEQICQLRANLQEKQKIYRLQMGKKQQTIKQMKINQEILNKKLKQVTSLQQQNVELKQKLKKFKMETQRKDTLVEHLKQKLQKLTNQLSITVQSNENQQRKLRKQVQTERQKSQSQKLKIGKLQTNNQLLKVAIIRLYQQIGTKKLQLIQSNLKQFNSASTKPDYRTKYEFTVDKHTSPTNQNLKQKYKQALSILQISCQDLQPTGYANETIMTNQGYGSPAVYKTQQGMKTQTRNTVVVDQESVIKLSRLLECEEIDTKAILEMFSYAMEG